METVLAICAGIGLSAACGFRVFVPFLVTSIAAHTGHLSLTPSFAWIGSNTALIAFSAATALEIAGYYVPWLDHLLDTISSPAAVVAGTILTAAMVTHMSPFLKWTLAVIAGGGSAGIVQGATVLARGASFAGTGGLANPLVSTAELGGSIFTSIFAIVAPFMALAAAALVLSFLVYRILRKKAPAKIFQPQTGAYN